MVFTLLVLHPTDCIENVLHGVDIASYCALMHPTLLMLYLTGFMPHLIELILFDISFMFYLTVPITKPAP